MTAMTFKDLRDAVTGEAAAIRYVLELQPMGGLEDKVFPPTYAGGKYAMEQRTIAGFAVQVALLDSVQSQANRLESALQAAYDEGTLKFPLALVDFSAAKVEGLNSITALQAPHRIADAIFRDSELDGVAFRDTEVGKQFTSSHVANATGLFELCPTALIFGIWDSTGAEGGLGNKFARALVSEIVGYHALAGVKTASRIDPLEIEKCKIFEHKDSTESVKQWTVLEADAKKDDKGVPILFKRKKADKGKPSEINHGNVTPDIVVDDRSNPIGGGVTISKAVQTTVLSLPALRRLRFPDGAGKQSPERNQAARTVLAALALAAITQQRHQGYALRSRCDLLPKADGTPFEILTSATTKTPYSLKACEATAILGQAVEEAKLKGLKWSEKPVQLKPKASLMQLVQQSRALAALSGDQEGE